MMYKMTDAGLVADMDAELDRQYAELLAQDEAYAFSSLNTSSSGRTSMVSVQGGRRVVSVDDGRQSRTYMVFRDGQQPREVSHADARGIAWPCGQELPEFGHPVRCGDVVLRRVS